MTSSPPDAAEPSRDDLLRRLTTLEGKLATLGAIEQTKGAIMLTYGLSADAAFELLRFHSQARNVKLHVIAGQVASQLNSSPTGQDAIFQFDRLFDQIGSGPRTSPGPAPGPDAGVLPDDIALLWPQIAARQQPRATAGLAPGGPPPGITIAGNAANLPLVYVNDAFTELTGYPAGDVLGRNCRFLQGAATDPKHIATLSRGMHAGRDVSVIIRNYRSDGSPFLNQVSISPLRDAANQITHFIATQIEVDHQQKASIRAEHPTGVAPVITLRPRATPTRNRSHIP